MSSERSSQVFQQDSSFDEAGELPEIRETYQEDEEDSPGKRLADLKILLRLNK